MAGFVYSPQQGCNNPAVVTVVGSFAPQGTDAPTLLAGRGVTVTHIDVGKYKVALADTALSSFIGGTVSLGMNAPNGTTVTFVNTSGAIFDSANNCVYIQALVDDLADTEAEIAAVELDAETGTPATGEVISFVLFFTKSTLPTT